MQLENDRLHQRRERDRVVHAGLGIANSELERVEERMEPDVPPDLLGVIDAVSANKQLKVILVL